MMNAVPPDEAIARHAEMILDGNRFLADRPELILRDDEYVLEPDSADYRLPTLLLKTAPDLALCFQELLDALLHLNREHVDERVVDVQAYFSLTGEHEELEHAFYQWTMNYLSRRADLDRLNHRNAYDPSRLWVDTAKEIDELIERRIGMVNTINSSALNLAQAAYLHHPYAMVVADHKRRGGDGHVFEPNRYSIPDFNNSVFYALQTKQRFETFLKQVASRLPVEDQTPRHDRHYDDVVMRNQQFAEDLNLIRLISTNTQQFDVPLPTNCGYMLQAVWAISCGRSILTLLVFDEPKQISRMPLVLSIRRDGRLACAEMPWIHVDPEEMRDECAHEAAVNRLLLDGIFEVVYPEYDQLDVAAVIERGKQPEATDAEKTAVLAVLAGRIGDAAESGQYPSRVPKLGPLRRTHFEGVLRDHFGCTARSGKGSERFVQRGERSATFGSHKKDCKMEGGIIQRVLKQLEIPFTDFTEVLSR